MANSLEDFKAKLQASPALRAQVLSDSLGILQKHGVDIHDTAVQSALGLNKVSLLGPNREASSVIITITS